MRIGSGWTATGTSCAGTRAEPTRSETRIPPPAEAPGVGTPVRGGATLREAHLAMEIVHDSGAMVAMDLVEINPILDRQNQTAELCAELIASAFGRRIL
jgi:arginase family enzyme